MSAWVVRIAGRYHLDRHRDRWHMTGQEALGALAEPQAVFRGSASQVDDRVDPNTSHGVLGEGE